MKALKWIIIVIAVLYACCITYAFLPQQSVSVKKLAHENSRFIQVNGRKLHYEKYGSGKPVVLVHGFAGSTYTWRHIIPLLSDTLTVYAVDLPGFGLSDKSPDACYDLRSQAQAVVDFTNALNLHGMTLVGHSMGGVIAGIAAQRNSRAVEKAVIIDAGFYHGGPPEFFKKLFFPFDVIMARSFYTKSVRAKSLATSYYDKSLLTDTVIEHYLRPALTPHAADALVKMLRTASSESYAGIAAAIPVPTLLIWARQDAVIPLADAFRLRREIKNSQLVIIDQAGHMVQEELPQAVARAIRQFLK